VTATKRRGGGRGCCQARPRQRWFWRRRVFPAPRTTHGRVSAQRQDAAAAPCCAAASPARGGQPLARGRRRCVSAARQLTSPPRRRWRSRSHSRSSPSLLRPVAFLRPHRLTRQPWILRAAAFRLVVCDPTGRCTDSAHTHAQINGTRCTCTV